MTIEPTPFEPDWVIHPGTTLSEFIIWRWSEENGLDPQQIADICEGRASVTDEIAEKLSKIGRMMSAQFWKNLQKSYDTTVERLKSQLKSGE
jgi:plasmid maintenance system antidote protein VapI